MKEHNDELQENIVFVSNHRNELKLLINSQRKFIKDETIRSKEQISQWLRKYIDNLNTEKARIDRDIDNAEKEGQVRKKFHSLSIFISLSLENHRRYRSEITNFESRT